MKKIYTSTGNTGFLDKKIPYLPESILNKTKSSEHQAKVWFNKVFKEKKR